VYGLSIVLRDTSHLYCHKDVVLAGVLLHIIHRFTPVPATFEGYGRGASTTEVGPDIGLLDEGD
jgi:hypothetical protein